MSKVDAMAERLPHLYRDGALLRGSATARTGGVLDVPAVQLEVVDEDALEVQVAHWFGTARSLDETAALAAILDIAPESWQTLPLFRAWVESLRDAMLDEGAVTVRGLQRFVEAYTAGFQSATRIAAVPRIAAWSDRPSPGQAAFVESPPRRRDQRVPSAGGIEPLHQFQIVQRGLDETTASFLLTGLAAGPEYVPTLVNVTTGQALVFRDPVPPGQRLWLTAGPGGTVAASLEGRDVSARCFSVAGVTPGTPWTPGQVREPAQPMTLARGANDLWFLPLAHHDTRGLDRFLLALADLLMQQGRYDQSRFDHAIFDQEPAVIVDVTWQETQPATVQVGLPAGLLLSARGRSAEALEARAALGRALTDGVGRLKAAGVDARVELCPFTEGQTQMDFLRMVMPIVVREQGPTGADRLPDAGGVFEVTAFEQSTYR